MMLSGVLTDVRNLRPLRLTRVLHWGRDISIYGTNFSQHDMRRYIGRQHMIMVREYHPG